MSLPVAVWSAVLDGLLLGMLDEELLLLCLLADELLLLGMLLLLLDVLLLLLGVLLLDGDCDWAPAVPMTPSAPMARYKGILFMMCLCE